MFRKNFKSIFLVSLVLVLLYCIYSYLVLSPHLFTSFSLIDDGQSIQNTDYFDRCFFNKSCNELKNILIEKTFGRFRPLYWVIQYSLYTLMDLNPILHHLFRVYIVGLILLLLLIATTFQSGGGFLAAFVSSFIFFTTYSYSENIIRLGPVEPYQVFFIGLTSLLFLSKSIFRFKVIIIYIFAIISLLIKETSIVLVVPIIVVHYISNKNKFLSKDILTVILILIIFIVGRIISKPNIKDLAYIDNFKLDVVIILNNIMSYFNIIQNSIGLHIKVSGILMIFALYIDSLRKKLFDKYLYYWLSLVIVSILVLLPWKYILERYLLLTFYCLSIVIGLVLSKTIYYLENIYNKLTKVRILFPIVILINLSNLLFYTFPINLSKSLNYKNWYKEFLEFEHDQVYALSNIHDGVVYINAVDNIENWEVLYEIPIHLKYIFKSKTKVKLLDEKTDLTIDGFLFTRIPFIHILPYEEIINLGKIIDSKHYEISQIDSLEFQNIFYQKPIYSIINPPLKNDKFTYYWEIRKL